MIAKNWNIKNRDNDEISYHMLIEVKAPNANDRKHAKREVKDYLQHVPNVILTDLVTWEFYTKDEYKFFSLEEPYCKVCERGENNKEVHWKTLEVKNSESLVMEDDPNEWKEILRKLHSIIISK